MQQVKREFGKLNPNAPAELSRFSFLIGKWRFEAKVKLPVESGTSFRERGLAATSSTVTRLRTNTG